MQWIIDPQVCAIGQGPQGAASPQHSPPCPLLFFRQQGRLGLQRQPGKPQPFPSLSSCLHFPRGQETNTPVREGGGTRSAGPIPGRGSRWRGCPGDVTGGIFPTTPFPREKNRGYPGQGRSAPSPAVRAPRPRYSPRQPRRGPGGCSARSRRGCAAASRGGAERSGTAAPPRGRPPRSAPHREGEDREG